MINRPKDHHRQTVGVWLKRPFVWRIPVYQRHYEWKADNKSGGPITLFWETVKKQTIARLDGDVLPRHYLGAVLVDEKPKQGATTGITHYDVVDGQQRLTTIQLALLALISVAKDHGFDSEMKEKLGDYVLSDKENQKPLLFPTNFDKDQFEEVLFRTYRGFRGFGEMGNVSQENAEKSKILEASKFFKEQYAELVDEQSAHEPQKVLHAIRSALTDGIDIVLIVLEESDEAQQIFESLNSVAERLTTFDLIRNNVFYRAGSGKDEELFGTQAWQGLEHRYWADYADLAKTNRTTHIEAYIARMLVAERAFDGNVRFDRNNIVETYRSKFAKRYSSIDDEIKNLVRYTGVYLHLARKDEEEAMPAGANNDFGIDFGVFRYRVWKSRDFYPVLFRIAHCSADIAEKRRMVALLESYVIRRSVCGLSIGDYNKRAAALCTSLGDKPGYESLRDTMHKLDKDSALFPKDDQVADGCAKENFYKQKHFSRYVFEKIELSLHDARAERVVVPEGVLTIDHILPQGWEENLEWRKIVLGEDGVRDELKVLTVNAHLHTIGNLTIMSGRNNSQKSNRPLDEVKELLMDSTVKLNRELVKEATWNVEKIAARSKYLAAKICKIWPYDIPG